MSSMFFQGKVDPIEAARREQRERINRDMDNRLASWDALWQINKPFRVGCYYAGQGSIGVHYLLLWAFGPSPWFDAIFWIGFLCVVAAFLQTVVPHWKRRRICERARKARLKVDAAAKEAQRQRNAAITATIVAARTRGESPR